MDGYIGPEVERTTNTGWDNANCQHGSAISHKTGVAVQCDDRGGGQGSDLSHYGIVVF